MVGGHGALREGFSPEECQSDVVVFASGNEFESHLFGRFDAVGFQVGGEHTLRNVHCDHDVDAFHFAFAVCRARLWSRQNDDGENKDEHSQHEGQMHCRCA